MLYVARIAVAISVRNIVYAQKENDEQYQIDHAHYSFDRFRLLSKNFTFFLETATWKIPTWEELSTTPQRA